MARQGNTTAVGLGYQHQRDRKRAIAVMPDGTPCQLCGKPMHRTQQLHYDHIIPRALGGKDGPRRIVHASCNVRAGQRLAVQLRRRQRGKVPARRYNRW
jgi:5-methylcytosine-specific restriction endonuclease McrA